MLAICRGHQLLNVALGGSLLQHIEDNATAGRTTASPAGTRSRSTGTAACRAYGNGATVRVNSRHHQGITADRLAAGLRSVATSHDDYVEAMESTAHRWVVGVQWHPERPEMRPDSAPLFSAFVEASR